MFLTSRVASVASGDRSPHGGFWFSPVSFSFGAGPVTTETALSLAAVYACTRVLAETVSTLPFRLYREREGGGTDPIREHWLYKLFAKRPNRFQNPMEFMEMMMGHLVLRGNAYAEIFSNRRGEVVELIPLHPDRVRIEMLAGGEWRYVVSGMDGSTETRGRGQIFHIKGMSGNGVTGYSPIGLARNSISLGLASQDYGLRFFVNDAKPGGWIEHPGSFPTDEKRGLFREQWQAQQTGSERHKVAVLEFGMKFHEVKVSNEDAQFIETRKLARSEVASWMRVPLHMIQDLERATNNNIEQMSLEFVMYSIMPWLVRWEKAIEWYFVDDDESSEDYGLEVEFPIISLLRGDQKARAEYYKSGIDSGWLVRNEARVSEGLNPLPGLNAPLRPLNMAEEGEERDEEEGTSETASQRRPATEASRSARRLRMLMEVQAARLATRAIKTMAKRSTAETFDDEFASLLSAALAMPIDMATQCCAALRDEAVEPLSEASVKQKLLNCALAA